MYKRMNAYLLIIASAIVFNYPYAVSAENDLSFNAAEYICARAKESKKTRLAVYAFTDGTGEISSKSREYSTRIMSLIINKKEFKVIDPETVPEIIREQEKGLTGLVDPETAAETGKIIGADALIFGISGNGSLQVRIVDSKTGELIGATLEESDGKTSIKNEDFKSPEAKNNFILSEFERNLNQLSVKQPMLYLYITANDKELAELDETFPAAMTKLKHRINGRDPDKNARLDKRKRKLADFRNSNSGFDSRIRESRKNLIEHMKNKKR